MFLNVIVHCITIQLYGSYISILGLRINFDHPPQSCIKDFMMCLTLYNSHFYFVYNNAVHRLQLEIFMSLILLLRFSILLRFLDSNILL